jgi:hypothetical protein
MTGDIASQSFLLSISAQSRLTTVASTSGLGVRVDVKAAPRELLPSRQG